LCVIYYYENDKLQYEVNFKNGKQNGLFQAWHKNGQLKWKVNYINSERNGLNQGWYENVNYYGR